MANRRASVRVGRNTKKEGKGYFKDRRLASNMDANRAKEFGVINKNAGIKVGNGF